MNPSAHQCAPGVRWTVELDGVLLFLPGARGCRKLNYPAAALWDFVTRDYNLDQMTRMMQPIAGFPDSIAAARFVKDQLNAWSDEGLLVLRAAGAGHG